MKIGPKTVSGNLASDPVWRDGVNGGDKFLTMRLLDTPRVMNRETKQWGDGDTVAYDVAVREQRMAQHIANSVRSGDRLTVSGTYHVDPYMTRDSKAEIGHRLYAQDVSVSLKFTDVQIQDRKFDRSRDQQVERDVQGPDQNQQSPAPSPSTAPTNGAGGFPPPAQAQTAAQAPAAANSWGQSMADRFQDQPPTGSVAHYQGPSR